MARLGFPMNANGYTTIDAPRTSLGPGPHTLQHHFRLGRSRVRLFCRARSNRLYSAEEVTDLRSRPPFPEAGIGAQQNRSKGGTVGRQLPRSKGAQRSTLRQSMPRRTWRRSNLRGRRKQGDNWNTFDVSADGQRFLIPRPDPANADACQHCGPQLGWHAEQDVMSILMSFSYM